MSKALILGFFDRGNHGDELYKEIYSKYLTQPNVQFTYVCIDDLESISDEYNILILAGGDLVNDHFFKRLIAAGIKDFDGAKYAFSIGIPYPSCIPYLDLFDHVILRSSADYEAVSKRLGREHVSIAPDFVLLRSRQVKPKPVHEVKTVAVCLARPIINNNPFYHYVVNRIAQALDLLADRHPSITLKLMPFNTNLSSKQECDIYINREVHELVRNKERVVMTKSVNFKDVDFVIGMRYHSLILSILHQKPFMAMYTTRKIRTLLADIGRSQFGYDLDTAYNFDLNTFSEIYERAQMNLQNPFVFPVALPNVSDRVICEVNALIANAPRRTNGAVWLDPTVIEKNLEVCLESVSAMLGVSRNEVTDALTQTSPNSLEGCARAIIFAITGSVEHDCLWGLMQQIGKPGFSLLAAVKYITEEFYREGGKDPQITPSCNLDDLVKVNMTYMQQFTSKQQHRSGWNAVLAAIMTINDTAPTTMLLDAYVDRTFAWGQQVLVNAKIVPYKQPWMGFIHHTFDESHSRYNCAELMRNPVFLESLKTCKTLFVLSNYLKTQLRVALDNQGFTRVPIVSILHPTEFVSSDKEFTMAKFMANPDRSICQVGCWLRSAFAIYRLPTSTKKAALMGKNMSSYFRPPNLFSEIEKLALQCTGNNSSSICRPEMCRPECDMCRSETVNDDGTIDLRSGNKYVVDMLEYIKTLDASVTIIDRLENNEYDAFLASNIVFLNVVDASACNTVIECCVRCTPIIVNRHPALEEYLGQCYPLFYTTIEEAGALAEDMAKIEEAEIYLRQLDKSELKIETFMIRLREAILDAEF